MRKQTFQVVAVLSATVGLMIWLSRRDKQTPQRQLTSTIGIRA
jgi:hypothetical protein